MTDGLNLNPLETPSTRFRSTVTRGIPEDAIERDGGDFGAGLIKRTAVISHGEALGHGLWIDSDFLAETADAINLTGTQGVKARFTHPDASGDSLGSYLGRVKDARVEAGRVLADLHLAQSAHETPDGDLAGYVMTLAEEDPAAFGQSISFTRDIDAEERFLADNGADPEDTDENGLDELGFLSPDELNANNLRHARLAELRAVDSVDEPAANPDGLFHAGQRRIARDAERLIGFALGVSNTPPTETAFNIEPGRAAGFVSRYLKRNGLELRAVDSESPTKAEHMTEAETTTDATTEHEPSREDFAAELRKYTERFGAENGSAWFAAGTDWPDALDAHASHLENELAAKTAQVEELRETLAALRTGEDEALDLGDPEPNEKPSGLPIRLK
jgi:hypothetical protein